MMISESSGTKSASGVILGAGGYLCSIDIDPPASGSATLIIYDNPSAASGTVLSRMTVQAGQNSINVNLNAPQIANSGIYAALTGTTNFVIGFQRG